MFTIYNAFFDELSKIAAEHSPETMFAQSQAVREKMMPVLERETKRLHGLGFKNILPVSSTYAGINLPTEGGSDIDLNIGVRNVHTASKRLESLGIPYAETLQNQRIHRYRSPEGYDIEAKLRPVHEIEYQRKGFARLIDLPDAEKAKIIAEKHRLKSSGDEKAYKAYKYGIYERYGIIPPGGDWTLVKPKK